MFLKQKLIKKNQGFGIVEILVALAVFVVGVVSITLMYVNSMSISQSALERTRAAFLAEEGLEVMRAIANSDFSLLTDGVHELAWNGTDNQWNLVAENQGSGGLAGFERVISISDGSFRGKLIEVKITWTQPVSGMTEELSLFSNLNEIY